MAVAFRRLGQTLYNLDRIEESSQCLEKSEQLLRQLVARQPRNLQVVLALADTMMAYDECLDEEDDDSQLERFEFAVARCRDISSDHSPEFLDKFASLLSSQAKCQMQNDRVGKAIESLREADRILRTSTAPNEEQKKSLQLTSWEVQMLNACACRLDHDLTAARQNAEKTLEQIELLGQDWEDDTTVTQIQLCCLEIMGCLSNEADPTIEPQWRDMYARLKERLLRLAQSDGQEFTVEAEVTMLLVNDRLNGAICFSDGFCKAAYRYGQRPISHSASR